MKSGPVMPGSSLKSKPAWLNAYGYLATPAFFIYGGF